MNVDRYIRKKFHIHRGDKPPYVGWLKETTRNDLADLFNELGYKKGAEIGVCRAANALNLLKRVNDLHLLCIDPWGPYDRLSADRANDRYEVSKKRLKNKNATIIRKSSIDAVKDIEDNSLDFVYIDGKHDFDSVMLDLIYWTPKVRKGGIVSGHDYHFGGRTVVPRAVDAYVFAHGIVNLYLTKERFPSYFWVK